MRGAWTTCTRGGNCEEFKGHHYHPLNNGGRQTLTGRNRLSRMETKKVSWKPCRREMNYRCNRGEVRESILRSWKEECRRLTRFLYCWEYTSKCRQKKEENIEMKDTNIHTHTHHEQTNKQKEYIKEGVSWKLRCCNIARRENLNTSHLHETRGIKGKSIFFSDTNNIKRRQSCSQLHP